MLRNRLMMAGAAAALFMASPALAHNLAQDPESDASPPPGEAVEAPPVDQETDGAAVAPANTPPDAMQTNPMEPPPSPPPAATPPPDGSPPNVGEVPETDVVASSPRPNPGEDAAPPAPEESWGPETPGEDAVSYNQADEEGWSEPEEGAAPPEAMEAEPAEPEPMTPRPDPAMPTEPVDPPEDMAPPVPEPMEPPADSAVPPPPIDPAPDAGEEDDDPMDPEPPGA